MKKIWFQNKNAILISFIKPVFLFFSQKLSVGNGLIHCLACSKDTNAFFFQTPPYLTQI